MTKKEGMSPGLKLTAIGTLLIMGLFVLAAYLQYYEIIDITPEFIVQFLFTVVVAIFVYGAVLEKQEELTKK